MQIDGGLLTAHSWTLAGIIVLVAGALGGVAAFAANFLKSVEVLRNIYGAKRKALPVEAKSAEAKPGLDLRHLGIPRAFEAPTTHSIRNMAIGGAVGATLADLAAAQSHDHAPHDVAHADAHNGVHVASEHASAGTDAHQAITDHAHHWWDFISNILSS